MQTRKLAVDNNPYDRDESTIKGSGLQDSSNEFQLAGLTIQVEQFFTAFIENTTAVMFKEIRSDSIKPAVAYHQYRQLLLYVESLHQMMYNDLLGEDIINLITDMVPNNLQKQDENMFANYSAFFRDMLSEFANHLNYRERKEMENIVKEVRNQLDHDYGYEANIKI